jgi:SNF2 family DNA or RNA helicase
MPVYKPAKSLWTHQAEGLKKSLYQPVFAYLMAMRTGKSPLTCADFGQLELDNLAQDLMIFAPAGAYRTWETVFDLHLSEDLKKRMLVHVWESGNKTKTKEREQDWFMAQHGKPRALLINTEAFSTVKMARDLAKKFLEQRSSYAACDEATDIKSPKSERAKFAVDEIAPRANYRRILTGLPTPKSPLDAYMQFEFLDTNILGFRSFEGFKTRYAKVTKIPAGPIKKGRGGEPLLDERGNLQRVSIERITGYHDVEEIHAAIAPHAHRVRLEDCYDLPPKMYAFRDVEWHPTQKRVYEEMKTFATAQLDELEHVTAHHVITQMLRLHQILCGHVRTEDGRIADVPENRVEAICDLLEEHDGKSIIWCAYDHSLNAMVEGLKKRFKKRVARFWGGNRKTREEEEKMFLGDRDCPYIVATAAAGGRGRTWVSADTVIYHSCTDNLEHRLQSEERAQGVDKVRSVGYYDFRIRGTVEEKFYGALRNKLDLASVVVGDNYRQWII